MKGFKGPEPHSTPTRLMFLEREEDHPIDHESPLWMCRARWTTLWVSHGTRGPSLAGRPPRATVARATTLAP
jgi:hypothetical protein